MDFLARKWAIELPNRFTWVKLQKRKPLTSLRESLMIKPNSGWFEPPAHSALDTVSASPSKVASNTLSSNANWTPACQSFHRCNWGRKRDPLGKSTDYTTNRVPNNYIQSSSTWFFRYSPIVVYFVMWGDWRDPPDPLGWKRNMRLTSRSLGICKVLEKTHCPWP